MLIQDSDILDLLKLNNMELKNQLKTFRIGILHIEK